MKSSVLAGGLQIDSWIWLPRACCTGVLKVKMLPGKLMQIMFAVCLSAALLRGTSYYLTRGWLETETKKRSCHSFTLLGFDKGEPVPIDMFTPMFDSFLQNHISSKRFFFKVWTFVFLFYFSISSSSPVLLYARSVQPLTAVAMAAHTCSTENVNANYSIL